MTAGLDLHGLDPRKPVHWNLTPAELVEAALARGEGQLAADGGFRAETAPHTGRSPNDKFTVKEPSCADVVDWGKVNVPISPEHYDALEADIQAYLNEQELFVLDAKAGADEAHGIGVRVVTPSAWHNLFAWNMFLRTTPEEQAAGLVPDFTVLHAPEMQADPEKHGTRSTTGVVVNFAKGRVLICGTRYAGEIKKSIFGALNFRLPDQGVLPMHCSANVGDNDDVALFFGLSGTGKTTLSADASRGLIGDDEHGWGDTGVFNFEGGCYAKTIKLSAEGEPEIFAATRRFGTVLENVGLREDRSIDYDDATITQNTRASYPIHFIPNAVEPSRGGHPQTVVFLTADAFGVLPPISKLTPEQAQYQFLSGYTAKVAGTERGVTEPQATFSACFGAPFLPLHPGAYATMLGEKLAEHGSRVFLVNTGWTGGPFGVGSRMKLSYTRAMVNAVLRGDLDEVETTTDPIFGLAIPNAVPGVPDEVLQPRNTWADPAAYDAAATKLAEMFRTNFEKYADGVSDAVKAAGPKG